MVLTLSILYHYINEKNKIMYNILYQESDLNMV